MPRSLPAAIDDRAFAGTRNPATRKPKSLAEGMGIRTTISNASSCVALWQQPGEGEYRVRRTDRYIRLGDNLLLGRFGPPTLPQPHSWASAVVVNEFDAGSFQSAANSQVIGRRH